MLNIVQLGENPRKQYAMLYRFYSKIETIDQQVWNDFHGNHRKCKKIHNFRRIFYDCRENRFKLADRDIIQGMHYKSSFDIKSSKFAIVSAEERLQIVSSKPSDLRHTNLGTYTML